MICEVYLDDIIIFSTTLEDVEHIEHVRRVIQRLDEHNLKIKIEKCKVAQEVICYLSHIISHGHISPSQAKIADLFKFTTPLNAKQIHSFIGLGSYYRKFIAHYSTIVSPLLRAIQEKYSNGHKNVKIQSISLEHI